MKTYLTNVEEGDIIRFEMPPFCSGEYLALVKKDEVGHYIDKKDDFFEGCRDSQIITPKDDNYQTFKDLV